ncbi:MAG: hypothetical protein WEA04_02505 [Candidatus Andersenbacteria bacterium]
MRGCLSRAQRVRWRQNLQRLAELSQFSYVVYPREEPVRFPSFAASGGMPL